MPMDCRVNLCEALDLVKEQEPFDFAVLDLSLARNGWSTTGN